MKRLVLFNIVLISMLTSCKQSNSSSYSLNNYNLNYDGVLDTILPHFAKLHDSMKLEKKFSEAYKTYMQVHKKERGYEWINYHKSENNYDYFMVLRLEPSMKKDKYTAICGRFKRNDNGAIDSASYEELFWTWKMKKPELLEKSNVLFKEVIENGNVDAYVPEKKGDQWVEFPGNGVVYDKSTQSWIQSGN
jgi:hypothetical protein